MYFNTKLLLKPLKPKNQCVCCHRTNIKVNKEHLFPKWLINRTNTNNTSIRWIDNKIPALNATLPICTDCNRDFGAKLEQPLSKIFNDLEDNKGLSDNEAELIVRWMWKTVGIAWCFNHPFMDYTHTYNLRERSLYPINNIRGSIILAISLIKGIDPSFGDLPMGFDSSNKIDCIFCSGVFSKVAIIVSLNCFYDEILQFYDIYELLPQREKFGNMKIFYPKTGFRTCVEAVNITKILSDKLSKLHDEFALELYGKANKTFL